MNSRRTWMQIYVDILHSIRAAGGELKKTHIVYKANLTHTRLAPCLEFLLSNGFLTEEKRGSQTYYHITEKGRSFLDEAKKLKEISNAFGFPVY